MDEPKTVKSTRGSCLYLALLQGRHFDFVHIHSSFFVPQAKRFAMAQRAAAGRAAYQSKRPRENSTPVSLTSAERPKQREQQKESEQKKEQQQENQEKALELPKQAAQEEQAKLQDVNRRNPKLRRMSGQGLVSSGEKSSIMQQSEHILLLGEKRRKGSSHP